VIAETAAAANARQQRKAIPTQGDFFMPGDEAGAAQVVIWILLPLVSHPGAQARSDPGNFCMPSDWAGATGGTTAALVATLMLICPP